MTSNLFDEIGNYGESFSATSKTIKSFCQINSQLTFLKPELDLFLRAIKWNEGRRYLKIVDVPSIEEKEFRENFSSECDIIECSSVQSEYLSFFANHPSIVVCHHSDEKAIFDCQGVKYLIVSSANDNDIVLKVKNDSPTLSIYCANKNLVIETEEGKELETNQYEFSKDRELIGADKKIDINPTRVSDDNNRYFIYTKGNPSKKARYSSVFVKDPRSKIVLKGSEDPNFTTYFLIHGRVSRGLIFVEGNSSIKVVFPDMAKIELNAIMKDDNFFGCDSIQPGTSDIGNDQWKYLMGRKTFSEIIYPHFTDYERLSKIDNYIQFLVFRHQIPENYRNMKELYIKHKLENEPKRSASLTISERKLKKEIVDSSEMSFAVAKALRERSEKLTKRAPIPYIDEVRREITISQVREYIAKVARSEEKIFENLEFFRVKNSVISNYQYVYLELDKSENCIVQNCDIVILDGIGHATIYGNIHTLINRSEDVNITFTNEEEVENDEEIQNSYLFVDKSNIYSSMREYDKKSLEELNEKILELVVDEEKFKEPPANVRATPKKSIIRNFHYYFKTSFEGFYTATIENVIYEQQNERFRY